MAQDVKEDRSLVLTLTSHTDVVFGAVFTENGIYIVSASADKTIRVWERATGRCVQVLSGHEEWVTAICVAPGDQEVVSCGADALVKIWSMSDGRCMRTLEGHSDMVRMVVVTPDKRRVVSGGYDRTTRVWDFATGVCVRVISDAHALVESVGCSGCGGWVLSAGDACVRAYDAATLTVRKVMRGHTHHINAVAATPDGRHVLTASSDRTVGLWDLQTGECVWTKFGHQKMVLHVAVSRCGRWAASCSWDSAVILWRLPTGEQAANFGGHGQHINVVEFSPCGRYLVTGSDEGLLSLWDLHVILEPFFALRWALVLSRWRWQSDIPAIIKSEQRPKTAAKAPAVGMRAPMHGGGGSGGLAGGCGGGGGGGVTVLESLGRGTQMADAEGKMFLMAVFALPEPVFRQIVRFVPCAVTGGGVLDVSASSSLASSNVSSSSDCGVKIEGVDGAAT